jgi:hypothetical protein
MSVPATDKASPAPAVTERARSAARSDPPGFPATTPEVSGPPEHRSFRCVPIPLPVPAGSSCVSAGTSREDCDEPSPRHRLSSVPPVTGPR